jgi:hypothetical protein
VPSGLASLQVNGKSNETKIEGGILLVGKNEPPGDLKITGGYEDVTGSATVTVVAADTPAINKDSISIKEKFNVTKPGIDGVKEAFEKLSAFIKEGGLTDPDTNDVIKLGDYIDLEGGLTVNAYGGSGTNDPNMGYFSWDVNEKINVSGTALIDIPLVRLVVVGIDSFRTGKGYNNQYEYPDGEMAPPAHVVFQFRTIPVYRRMDASENASYPGSEMRKYLTPVGGDNTTGNFYNGLLKAGVPKDVLWAPARMVATHEDGAVKIHDLLWLPTEREMFPDGKDANNKTRSYAEKETNDNQARLEYYNKPEDDWTTSLYYKRGKSAPVGGDQIYWLSSADASIVKLQQGFCMVQNRIIERSDPGYRRGVVPAFCVQ